MQVAQEEATGVVVVVVQLLGYNTMVPFGTIFTKGLIRYFMRKIFMIILPVVFTILCCKQKDSFLNEANFMTKDTLITLIFKDRTFKTDTIRYKNGIYGFKTQNLIYSIDGSFLEYPLPKNNYKKNDTIKIVSKKDIILYHGYYYNLYSLYKFKPGDIVEFGVFKGESINYLAKSVSPKTIFGFDSFRGLEEDFSIDFAKGGFNQNGITPKVENNVVLVEGSFSDSLPKWLNENNGVFSFINIDCDVHQRSLA
jgi:hypothetical protein